MICPPTLSTAPTPQPPSRDERWRVTHDHLDLLLTAGGRYGVHADTLTKSPRLHLAGVSWTGAGHELATALHDVLKATHTHPVTCPEYRPAPVSGLVPLEVVRAARYMEQLVHLSADLPGDDPAGLKAYLRDLIRAAIDRLPGYSAMPATWTRSRSRSGPAVAVGSLPALLRRRLTLVDEPRARSAWPTAKVIVLDLAVVTAMASGPVLPEARPDVHVLVAQSPTAAEWVAMLRLGVSSIVADPIGLPWLLDQLPTPSLP